MSCRTEIILHTSKTKILVKQTRWLKSTRCLRATANIHQTWRRTRSGSYSDRLAARFSFERSAQGAADPLEGHIQHGLEQARVLSGHQVSTDTGRGEVTSAATAYFTPKLHYEVLDFCALMSMRLRPKTYIPILISQKMSSGTAVQKSLQIFPFGPTTA